MDCGDRHTKNTVCSAVLEGGDYDIIYIEDHKQDNITYMCGGCICTTVTGYSERPTDETREAEVPEMEVHETDVHSDWIMDVRLQRDNICDYILYAVDRSVLDIPDGEEYAYGYQNQDGSIVVTLCLYRTSIRSIF